MLCVPCEEAREVCVEGELDDGIFFLFTAIVVGAAFDSEDSGLLELGEEVGREGGGSLHLDVGRDESAAGVAGGEEVGCGDEAG